MSSLLWEGQLRPATQALAGPVPAPAPSPLKGDYDAELPAPASWPRNHRFFHQLAALEITLPPSPARLRPLRSLPGTPPFQRSSSLPEPAGPESSVPARPSAPWDRGSFLSRGTVLHDARGLWLRKLNLVLNPGRQQIPVQVVLSPSPSPAVSHPALRPLEAGPRVGFMPAGHLASRSLTELSCCSQFHH